MKVGCYSMDLYCDTGHRHGTAEEWGLADAMPWQYTGRTEAGCIRKAKASGWRFSGDKVYCPACAGKRANKA